MSRRRVLVGLVCSLLLAGLLSVPTAIAQEGGAGAPAPAAESSPAPAVSPSPAPSPDSPPSNDDPADATVIASLPFSDSPDLTDATNAGEPMGYCGPTTNTVWYAYYSESTQDVSVDLGAASAEVRIDAYLDGSPVGCFYGGQWSLLQVLAGGEYTFQVGTVGDAGTAPFTFGPYGDPHYPPANDDVADATIIGGLPYSDTVDLSAASTEPGEPDPCLGSPGRSAWYVVTPSTDMRVRLSTSGDFGVVGIFRTTWDDFTGTCVWGWSTETLDLDGGQTYLLQVTTSWTYAVVTIGLEEIIPPPNDDLADAEPITALPFSATAAFTNATLEDGEPWPCWDGNVSVWYSYEPPEDQRIQVETSDWSLGIAIFEGDWDTRVGCVFAGGGPLTLDVHAGQRYLLQAAGWTWQTSGGFQVRLIPPPPPNDAADSAAVIETLPFEVTDLPILGATTGPEDGYYYCFYPQHTVWYVYEAPEEMNLDVGAVGDWDVTVQFYRQADGRLQPFDCQRAGDPARRIRLQAGERVFLQLGTESSETAGLLVEQGPPPLDVEASIDPIGAVLKAGGGAAISGTLSCTREAEAWMTVEVRQALGRKTVIVGEASRALACSPEALPWTTFVFSDEGAFGGGSVYVRVRVEAYDAGEYDSVGTEAAVRLKGQIRL